MPKKGEGRMEGRQGKAKHHVKCYSKFAAFIYANEVAFMTPPRRAQHAHKSHAKRRQAHKKRERENETKNEREGDTAKKRSQVMNEI